jgi:hypothetical protein
VPMPMVEEPTAEVAEPVEQTQEVIDQELIEMSISKGAYGEDVLEADEEDEEYIR